MNSGMNDKEAVAAILEKIRARLGEQIASDAAAVSEPSPSSGSLQAVIPHFRALLDEMRTAQSEIGAVNPRPSGLFNDLIQLFKKTLRRLLGWYVRPIARYEETATRLFGEMIETLERSQTQLQSLEAKTEIQSQEIAELRQRVLIKLDSIAQQLAQGEKERS